MIGVDTNLLVRYVVRDDPAQTQRADAILESCTEEEPGFINAVVLAEFVWVLERRYQYERKEVFAVLEKMLAARELQFEHASAAWHAAHAYMTHKAGFVDLFIGRINRLHGCPTTKTFDQNVAATPDFEEA